MLPTLFGQSLRHGDWFIADRYGHRLPMKIFDVDGETEEYFFADNVPYLHLPTSVDIRATLCVGSIITKTDGIKKVIFNDPATIIIWEDGTKTIVKCQEGDTYSKELGLAMCFAKKYLGNKGNFNDIFKKYVKEEK